MPFVVGKKVKPPARTTVVWNVDGDVAFETGVIMGTDGRARSADPLPHNPTVRLGTDSEGFLVLCAGRRSPDQVPVDIAGDHRLASDVLTAMRITP